MVGMLFSIPVANMKLAMTVSPSLARALRQRHSAFHVRIESSCGIVSFSRRKENRLSHGLRFSLRAQA
jgi:hypothetical protein